MPVNAVDAVRVTIESTALALPEHDVDSVESVLDMQPAVTGDELACGHLLLAGERCPVYALDRGLGVVLATAPQRRVCVVIDTGAGPLAFLADTVTRLPAEALRHRPLPACMDGADGPILGLAVHDRQVLFDVSARSLGGWLAARVGPRVTALAS